MRVKLAAKCKPKFLDMNILDVKDADKVRKAVTKYINDELKGTGEWRNIEQFCHSFPFNAEDLGLQYPNHCTDIPLMETVARGKGQGQFVLGRVETLKTFQYNFCPAFVCLSLPYETRITRRIPAWTIELNDVFIMCGAMKNVTFPIRLVLDERVSMENLMTMKYSMKQSRSTKFMDIGIFDATSQDDFESVTWREICQLVLLHKMHLYQSVEFPNVFLFSKSSRQGDNVRLRRLI